MAKLFANSGDPDQMPHPVASDLGQHCLPVKFLGVFRLQWVKEVCWKTKLQIIPQGWACVLDSVEQVYRKYIYMANILTRVPTLIGRYLIRTNQILLYSSD